MHVNLAIIGSGDRKIFQLPPYAGAQFGGNFFKFILWSLFNYWLFVAGNVTLASKLEISVERDGFAGVVHCEGVC